MFGSVPAEQPQVNAAIGGIVKDNLTGIAALGDVVGNSRRHDPGHPWHLKREVRDSERKSPEKSGNEYPVTRFLAR
jgi:hypothetical protein